MTRVLPRSVRGRAVLATAVAMALSGIVLGVAMLLLVSRQAQQSQEEILQERMSDVLAQVHEGGQGADLDLGTSGIPNPVLVQVLDSSGSVLAQSAGLGSTARLCPALPESAAGPGAAVVDVGSGPESVIREVQRDDTTGAVVCAVLSDEPVQRATSTVLIALLIVLPLVVLGVCLAVWWAVGRALRSVESLRSQAESLAGTQAMVLKVDNTGDEVEQLGLTLNALLAELHLKSRSTRQFIADAGHELRTPLTTLRVALEFGEGGGESAARTALADALTDLDRLETLVQELLALARSDAMETSAHFEPVTLDAVIREAVEALQRTRPDVSLTMDLAPVHVEGDGAALRSMVDNLLANAVRHAASRVIVTGHIHAGQAVIRIDDDGAGLAPQDCSRVFERFVRLDDARVRDVGGSGLGLAIVASVAAAHGGRAEAAPGPGGHFTVTLPLA